MSGRFLHPGMVVVTRGAQLPCRVLDLLGGGGQGEVYRAELRGEAVAVKWYRPGVATTAQRRALEELIRRGAPSTSFLWPMDLVTVPGTSGFGYVMPLRQDRFVGMSDLVTRRAEPSARVLARVALGLAEAFLLLHAQGLCYRDISFGNAFFDPHTAEVLVCDNDNVTVDGSAGGGVLGTPRFMAPEVVRGDAVPSSRTDLFSLAVLLFHMFFLHHPFDGANEQRHRLLDFDAMRLLYGRRPIFIFDPDNATNRPVLPEQQQVKDLWGLYPKVLRQLFVRSFTQGVVDPVDGRVRESQWRQAMARLQDCVLLCDACGGDAEAFWYPAEPWENRACWRCGRLLQRPGFLSFEAGAQLVISPGTEVAAHHVVPGRLYDFSERLATVVRHPTRPGTFGLQNDSGWTWRVKGPAGAIQEVRSGQAVRVVRRAVIDFGPSRAEVRGIP